MTEQRYTLDGQNNGRDTRDSWSTQGVALVRVTRADGQALWVEMSTIRAVQDLVGAGSMLYFLAGGAIEEIELRGTADEVVAQLADPDNHAAVLWGVRGLARRSTAENEEAADANA
jgi:hypothetical protein